MHSKAKNYALIFCLFVFLFVIIGGGLHLNPGGAFLAAATGTPLVICVFNRRFNEAPRAEEGQAESLSNEVAYVSRKTESKVHAKSLKNITRPVSLSFTFAGRRPDKSD